MRPTFKPDKRFSQNFLVNPRVQQRIIDACDLKRQDVVLEIGPGLGAMTKLIAPQVKSLYAVEMDKRLIDGLKKEFNGSNAGIIQGDILKFPFKSLQARLKLVGNLPYNISTPIIEKLIEERDWINSFYIMVQKEYAARLCAGPDSKDYGSLSCFAQYYCQLKKLFTISRGSFHPAPKVDSVFIAGLFYVQRPFQAHNEDFLFRLIRTAFNQRRKTLRNALKAQFDADKVEEAAAKAKIDLKKRAENIPLKRYVELSNLLLEI